MGDRRRREGGGCAFQVLSRDGRGPIAIGLAGRVLPDDRSAVSDLAAAG
jgi:hypothetical protein